MKILIVVDKPDSAIDRLAKGMKRYNHLFDINILPVHPKKPSPEQLYIYQDLAMQSDIIHFYYYKSGEMLREKYPQILKGKPAILSHHNPYNALDTNADDYTHTVVNNETILKSRDYDSHLIHNGVDLAYWTAGERYTEEESVLMVANRIEAKKGVLPVAKACKKLGYKFILVGNISDANYWQECLDEGAIFHQNIPDEKLRELYRTSAVHVCNSVDNFESGTLPILESMACGLPVVTRMIGHVPELHNGKNMTIFKGQPDDVELWTNTLKRVMSNRKLRLKHREAGWDTVKNWGVDRTAYKYAKLYFSSVYQKPLVSVVIPTYNRSESLLTVLTSVGAQTYQDMEVLVVDDGSDNGEYIKNRATVKAFKSVSKMPIRHIYQQKCGYGLARARNEGVIEAFGSYILFLDDRLSLNKDAVVEMVNMYEGIVKKKTALWGVKDNYPKSFVENFSLFPRKEFIEAGMFNGNVTYYGGMTQEIRTRLEAQGWDLKRCDKALASSFVKSRSKWLKRDSIIKAKMLLYKMYGK